MSNLLESKSNNLSSNFDPIVSIIVLTYNQLNYTKQCLNSIVRQTTIPYEIIVVDNASNDETDYYLLEFRREIIDKRKNRNGLPANYCRNVQIILNGDNKGFAAGNNVGIAQSKGQYVLLLNNDVVVTENWLEQLLLVAEHDETIGILGPVTNYISGWQLVNKVNYDTNSLEGLDLFANEWRETNQGSIINSWRVVGFCMLIKRSVINKIGGLDIRYGLGNFEDDDFCIRSAIAGFKTVIVKSCFVHHFGSKSFRALGDKYKKLLENNWEIFKEKWGLQSAIGYRDDYDISSLLNQPFKEDDHYCSIVNVDKSAQTKKELAGQIMENIKIDICQKNYDKIKVDIGCGSRKPEGFIGVDIYPWHGVDIVADLTKIFPFPDNTVDEIRAYDCLEHLPNIIHSMNEIWRICKPGATVDILVPSTDGRGAFQDPTHVSFWNINSFMYYSIEFPPYLQLCQSYGFQGSFSILSLEHQESPGQVIHVRAILKVIKSDDTEIPVDIDDDEIGENLKLREINLAIFPDWNQPEDSLISALENVLLTVGEHPDRTKITLLINSVNFPIHPELTADLLLANLVLKILVDYQIDLSNEGAEITLIDEFFNQKKFSQVIKKVNYTISLEQEDREQLDKYAQQIERCDLESLKTKKFVRSQQDNKFYLQ